MKAGKKTFLKLQERKSKIKQQLSNKEKSQLANFPNGFRPWYEGSEFKIMYDHAEQ